MYKEKYFKRLMKLLRNNFYESSRLIVTDYTLELKIHFNDGKEENWIARQDSGATIIDVYFSVENEFNNRN